MPKKKAKKKTATKAATKKRTKKKVAKKAAKRKKVVVLPESHKTWGDKPKKALGRRVTLVREKRGMTIPELAEKMGAYIPQIYHLESGKFLPSLPSLVTLCKVLECSADYIVGLKKLAKVKK